MCVLVQKNGFGGSNLTFPVLRNASSIGFSVRPDTLVLIHCLSVQFLYQLAGSVSFPALTALGVGFGTKYCDYGGADVCFFFVRPAVVVFSVDTAFGLVSQ